MLEWQNELGAYVRRLSGDEPLTYTICPLGIEYLDQVNAIDREAFPTQWPSPNYKQELQNKIAHYIIATDDKRVKDSPSQKTESALRRMATSLMPWKKRSIAPEQPLQLFIAGFSGIWMMADEAHITNIAVRREYRGKGVGGLLLIATIDMALEFKASFLTLEVRASNIVAQELYSRYGFTERGVRRGYYLDNREDAVIMTTESIASPAFKEQLRQLRESLTKKLASEAEVDR
jgi:[ribosomal protein S18]-alanine N-acetyltransferase